MLFDVWRSVGDRMTRKLVAVGCVGWGLVLLDSGSLVGGFRRRYKDTGAPGGSCWSLAVGFACRLQDTGGSCGSLVVGSCARSLSSSPWTDVQRSDLCAQSAMGDCQITEVSSYLSCCRGLMSSVACATDGALERWG